MSLVPKGSFRIPQIEGSHPRVIHLEITYAFGLAITSLRLLTESGIILCWPNFQLMALLLLSVIYLKVIYLNALFLSLLMVQLHLPFQSSVVFPRALSFPLHFFCSSSMTFSALPLPLFMLLQMIQLCTFPPALIPLVLLLTALNPKLPWLQLLTLILRVFPSGVTKI